MSGVERTKNGENAIDISVEAEFRVGAMLARPASREIVIAGKAEMIEPRVMQALIALSRRQGEVVPRDQLIDECWDGRIVGDDAINRCIAKLRRLESADTFTLETIPRVGYRLTQKAGHAVEQQESPTSLTHGSSQIKGQASKSKQPMSRRRKWMISAGVALTVMAMCIAAGTAYFMQVLGAASFSEFIELVYKDTKPNVAVLPFDVIGNDEDSRYLADAIPAAINNQLVNLGFQVVSPAIAFQYRGERKAQAGKELGPRYVIDGSVRVDGDMLQVIARVDSVSRPVSVWSRTFEAELRDASQLPDRMAVAVASLQLFAASTRSAQFSAAPEVVAGAQRWAESTRTGDDMGAYLLAKGLLREMPNVFAHQTNYGISVGAALDAIPASERAGALADARKVVDSAASLTHVGAPYATQALMPTVDWASRERALRKGAETYTAYSSFRYALATLLSNAGRVQEAASFAHEATSIDPLSSTHMVTYAAILDTEGKFEAADVLYSRAERLWPNLESLELQRFSSALLRGDLSRASMLLSDAATEKVLNPSAEQRPYAAILRALSTHEASDIAAVERECSDPLKQARRRSAPCLIALIRLDRLDTFFSFSTKYFPEQRGVSAAERDARWLDNPLAWRNLRLFFRADMAALRMDNRVVPIFERMGLIDYWRATNKWPDFCATEPKSVCAQMRNH